MLLSVSQRVDSVVQFLTVLVIFILVLAATYWTTRYIAGYQKGKMKCTNMEMIDSFRISQNKYIQILRIGNQYLAVAVCKDTVTVLTTLEEDEIINPVDVTNQSMKFNEFFEKAKAMVTKDCADTEKETDQDEEA